jgi:hypothetical protein
MIRDNGEELPALSGIGVPDELHLRIEAIEDPEVVCGESLKPPIHTGIAIELDLPTLSTSRRGRLRRITS